MTPQDFTGIYLISTSMKLNRGSRSSKKLVRTFVAQFATMKRQISSEWNVAMLFAAAATKAISRHNSLMGLKLYSADAPSILANWLFQKKFLNRCYLRRSSKSIKNTILNLSSQITSVLNFAQLQIAQTQFFTLQWSKLTSFVTADMIIASSVWKMHTGLFLVIYWVNGTRKLMWASMTVKYG